MIKLARIRGFWLARPTCLAQAKFEHENKFFMVYLVKTLTKHAYTQLETTFLLITTTKNFIIILGDSVIHTQKQPRYY
jgi:hypothetical protein